MISNYIKAKEDVLKAYNEFMPLVEEIKQGRSTSYDTSLEALSKQKKNIEQDKFLLMIVGEAKSGKSTFINAYLGKEILPMDVKQCTSAIVEIRYGAKYILKATYADDKFDVIEDEEKIKNFLTTNAALDDEYRDIPVSIINIEILMHKQDKHVTEADIQDLMKGIENENLYHLPKKEYESKVRHYIKEKQPHWRNIVKKIEIKYPFDDEDLKGIEIVDTPGVNAEGRVGDITNKYIEEANAVMFLKPITGAALEATSFKMFLNSKSADRNKNAMFLILSRAANETEENIARIHDEALRQFPSINKKQIIPIDSKVELFINKVKNFTAEELQQYLMQQTAAKKLDSFLGMPWFTANGDRDKYLEELKKLSNFAVVDDALNLFAHKAQYIALGEFLGRMVTVLKNVRAKLKEDIDNNRLKAEDPRELENKLRNAKRSLEALTHKINTTVDEIADKYAINGGIIESKANDVMEQYHKEIKEIDPERSSSLDELEKISFRKVDIFTQFEGDLQKNIVAECDEALIAFSDKGTINYTTIKPDLTQEAIEKIKVDKKDKAYETKYYTTGTTFKKTESYSAFSQSKYYKLVKDSIEQRMKKIKNDAVSDLIDFVTQVTTAYRTELSNNAKIKQGEYNEILEAKQTAEELQILIAKLESQFGYIDSMLNNIESLRGGIDKNV